MWRILYPLRYFRVADKQKRRLDLWPTLLAAAIISSPFILLPGVSFFKPNGFLDKILTLVAALTGFYVAALVAAATFSHPDLDKVIRAGPIVLLDKDSDGKVIQEHLTRRGFACLIFGYLAFAAFVVSVLSALLVSMSGTNLSVIANWHIIGQLVQGNTWLGLRGMVIFFMCAMIAHIAVATALGLYYLMDRLYRRDREIVPKKPGSDAAA